MRSLRLALAATAVAGVVVPLGAAHAAPPQPPVSCHVVKYPIAQWTYNVPVVGGSYVYAYRIECYG